MSVPGRGALPVRPAPPSPGAVAGGGGSEGLGGTFRAGKSGVRTGSPTGASGVSAPGLVSGSRFVVFRACGRSGSSTVLGGFDADGFSHEASSVFGSG